jgi:large subunit ribosomal protein L22
MSKEVVAKAKYIKGSARKARIPAKIVKGMLALEAIDVLKYNSKASSLLVRKVIKSALANAVHNMGMQPELLYIDEVRVDKAPSLRRFRAQSKGNAAKIAKHNSHITVVLKSLEDVSEESEKATRKSSKALKTKEETRVKEEKAEKTVKVEKSTSKKSVAVKKSPITKKGQDK